MSDRDTRSRARETAEGRSVAKSLSELLGVIAGGVVVVYLIGGAVLSARLWAAGLPTLPVVSGLPRESLVALGLSTVLLPAIVLGGLACVVLLLIRRSHEPISPVRLKGPPGSDRGERKEARTGVAAILAVIAAVVGFLTVGALEDRATGAAFLGGVGGLVAAVITVQLAQYLAFQFAGRLLTVTAVALAALAAGLGGAASGSSAHLQIRR